MLQAWKQCFPWARIEESPRFRTNLSLFLFCFAPILSRFGVAFSPRFRFCSLSGKTIEANTSGCPAAAQRIFSPSTHIGRAVTRSVLSVHPGATKHVEQRSTLPQQTSISYETKYTASTEPNTGLETHPYSCTTGPSTRQLTRD